MYLPLGELTWRRARAEPFTPREWHKESGQRTRLLRSRSAHTLTPLMRPREKPEAERCRGCTNSIEHDRPSTPTTARETIVSPLPAREISRVTHVIEVGCCCSLTRLSFLAQV
ncbi:uncharacterized protein LOC143153817 [Ptiloglossa arizonensis]|uniref:uncharacterized protein LOC143153817 n=1 Tax=Ptiloglossa arizonensis TaxID=3350558 RepID=UPI003FA0EDD9